MIDFRIISVMSHTLDYCSGSFMKDYKIRQMLKFPKTSLLFEKKSGTQEAISYLRTGQ